MNQYHSFIASLPELRFNPGGDFLAPAGMEKMLREILLPEEIDDMLLLWYKPFHYPFVRSFFHAQTEKELFPFVRKEALAVNHESFGQLPAYLQKFIQWKENHHGELSERMLIQKLEQLYFQQLSEAENKFIRQWGEAEKNRLNLQAAIRCEQLNLDKTSELIKGNQYYELLNEFSVNQKVIQSEYDGAEKLLLLAKNNNTYLEKEMETDRLRWETIDQINRFEYFSVDIILGYFQKLLILDRWEKLFKPQHPTDFAQIAKQMVLQAQTNS